MSIFFWLFVNCSGLPKSHTLERTKSVLSFLIFKAKRILVWLWNRVIQGINDFFFVLEKGLKDSLKAISNNRLCSAFKDSDNIEILKALYG